MEWWFVRIDRSVCDARSWRYQCYDKSDGTRGERWETGSEFVCYTVRGGSKADLTHGGASNAAWA